MAEFVFTSPGAKFRERDLTFVQRNVGITTLGSVGETQKGPAFEPIYLQDKGEFGTRFGGQSTEKFDNNGQLRYQLPYTVNSYLEESNQLWVTRVLGLSGYDAGYAWAITLSAGADDSTSGITSTTPGTASYINGVYLGIAINQIGDNGSVFLGWVKIGLNTFTGSTIAFTATTYTGGSGNVDKKTYDLSATSYIEYENMVLAVIRSRATIEDVENASMLTNFDINSLTITANNTNTGTGDLFGKFTLTAKSGTTSEDYIVSLDSNGREYLPNVVGNEPKGKNTKIWVEAIYPDLIKKIDAEGWGYGVNTSILKATTDAFTNYKEQFQTPETPWIVSELRGNKIEKLFKLISISDGNSANQEIKISIVNIDPVAKEFDIIIRDFNDNDENVIVLESFTRCTMAKGLNNYVAQRIGTSDGEYDLLSKYVMVELDPNAPENAFPAGFEGYNFKNYAISATSASYSGRTPLIIYKTEYASNERLNRVYLGISEKGYDATGLKGSGINQNLFNYIGQSAFVKSKGFHMDSGATLTTTGGTPTPFYDGTYEIGYFDVGAGKFQSAADIVTGEIYGDKRSRKFTLVPYGGFDGWDENRGGRSYGDLYRTGGIYDGVAAGITPKTDFIAWSTAIDTFSNPEEVTINLFTTPGINWSDQNILITNTIDMIEQSRADSLYVIDTPNVDVDFSFGDKRSDVIAAEDIVDLLSSADIDSSYSATYFPWIQKRDNENNVNVWLPPTGEVVKAMAFTDNVKFPWFAPAGLTRGVIDARKSKYKMSLDARDILYAGRINPMADFADVGTAIFGQKTLQIKESALDRINIRRLLLQVKVLISNIAVRLIFEQNDQTTIDQFLAKANPVLDTIRRERGLTTFEIKMDSSNNTPESIDRKELYGEIYIQPTPALEYIGITFTLTPAGASFADLGI